MKNIPEIRIKGFEGEWKEKQLGEALEIGNGTDYKHLGEGNIPVYGTGGIIKYVDDYLYDGETVCIGRKGTIDSPIYHVGKIWTVDTLFYTYDFKDCNVKFLYYLFCTINWKEHNEATGVPSLSKENIKRIVARFPNLAEQQSLGSFFSSFDRLLSDHRRRLENLRRVKKSMLQKMFPQQGQTVPEIRFKGFSGEWEKAKLSTFLEVSEEKNSDNFYGIEDVLSVSGDYGVVNQIEFQGRSFAGASVAGYGVAETGDVIYTKSPLKSNPYGIIKTNKGKPGIVSVLYGVYHPIKGRTESSFVQTYFESDARLNNYLRVLINKGSKNTLLISDEDALRGEVCFPSYEEQQRLSSFLTSLDNLINDEVNYIDQLTRVKSTLLQKMFV